MTNMKTISYSIRKEKKIYGIKMPVFAENETRIPFIGLALIVGALKKEGYFLRQLDLNAVCHRKGFSREWKKQTPETFFSFEKAIHYLNGGKERTIETVCRILFKETLMIDTDYVLLSVGLYDNISSLMALCFGKYIKERIEGIKVIVGGERYPNYEPIYHVLDRISETGCMDFYIRSYGEDSLIELLNALENSGDLSLIPGVYYRDAENKFVGSLPRKGRQVRLPDFKGAIDDWHILRPSKKVTNKFFSGQKISTLILPVNLIYGCPNRCSFCRSALEDKKHINTIDPQVLQKEISFLKEKFETRYFFFADDVFNLSQSFVKKTCEALIKSDILWSDCAQFRGWTKELLQLTRESGAVLLYFGMETASPRLLKLINKNVDVRQAEKVLRWSHEAGIFNGIEIIAGFPTETDEDIQATIDFIERNSEYIDEVTINSFYLLAGSPMFVKPQAYHIENIVQHQSVINQQSDRYHSLHVYNFDEIGGLKWPDKVKQIAESTRRVDECLAELNLYGANNDCLHVLFELYHRWNDKTQVRACYVDWKSMGEQKSVLGKIVRILKNQIPRINFPSLNN
jgi:radical SAM superfamily enzyme YgiQ (UPF0313 family)